MLRKTPRLRFAETPVNDGTPGAAPAAKTFTQDDVTALAAAERDQGKRAGKAAAQDEINAAIKAAGLPDGTDLSAVLEAAKRATAADEAAKTQAQRDADVAAKAKADAEAYLATAAKTLHDAKVERALAGAVNATIAARALDVAVGADDDAIKAAVDKLKADVPGLFSTTAAAPTPGSDPGNPPAAKDTRLSAREEAKAWAEQRYGKRG